jgi:outer membrane lipoprotein carrier protein
VRVAAKAPAAGEKLRTFDLKGKYLPQQSSIQQNSWTKVKDPSVDSIVPTPHSAPMRFNFRAWKTVAIALALAGQQAIALPNVHTVAQAVDQHYDRLHSLQADFTEIYQGTGSERTESGTLWLKKPGKMSWEYRSPEEKLFVSDGKDAWLYLPAEKQVRKSSLKNLEDLRSPLAFLLGKTKLEKELDSLAFAPNVQAWKAEDSILTGIPRGMEDRVKQVLLEITPENRIARIIIAGTDDSITEYRFSSQKEDVPVPDSKFHFRAPPGTETVQDESGE